MSLHAMNRRTFLETATTVTAATLLTSRLGWAAGDHKIEKVGVQLYTVRDQMKDDFDGTIAKVAQIGYKEVEFAGYFGRTGIYELLVISEALREMLRENPSINKIKAEARKNGMIYLQEDGLRQVIQGRTSIEELLRVVK